MLVLPITKGNKRVAKRFRCARRQNEGRIKKARQPFGNRAFRNMLAVSVDAKRSGSFFLCCLFVFRLGTAARAFVQIGLDEANCFRLRHTVHSRDFACHPVEGGFVKLRSE